jgi:hypothetical protein
MSREHEQAHEAEHEPGYAEETVANFKMLLDQLKAENQLRHFGSKPARIEPDEYEIKAPRSFDRQNLKGESHPDWILSIGRYGTPIPGHIEYAMGVFDKDDSKNPLSAVQFVLDQDQNDVYGFEITGQPIDWPGLLRGTATQVSNRNQALLRQARS